MKAKILITCLLFMATSLYGQTNYVNVAKAGSLQQILEEKDYLNAENLVIAGELNGRDIGVLRALTGSKNFHEYDYVEGLPDVSQPVLKHVDLYDANIVGGGLPYGLQMETATVTPNYVFTWHRANDHVIGPWMFMPYITTTIQSFVMPSSVTQLDDGAFQYCSSLQGFHVNEGVERIGAGCFTMCRSMTRIVLPSSLQSLGELCFNGCEQLATIYCKAQNPPLWENVGMCFDEQTLSGATLVVPEGCAEAYKNSAWGGFAHISEAADMQAEYADIVPAHHEIAPDIVEPRVGKSCAIFVEEAGTLQQLMEDCGATDCETLAVGGQLNGRDILYLRILSGLRNDFQAQNISYMNENGLPQKPGTTLKKLNLLDAHIVSGGGPYLKCRSIADAANTENWLRTSDDVAGESMFDGVWKLSEIVLPATTKTIGDYLCFGCIGLNDAFFVPEGVESIGMFSFYSCRELQTVVLPSSLKTIGKRAFRLCESLSKVYCLSDVPPTLPQGESAFEADVLEQCVLVVPANCAEAYKNAEGWKDFKNVEESGDIAEEVSAFAPSHDAFPNSISGSAVGQPDRAARLYAPNGMSLSQPVRGIYVEKSKSGNIRKRMAK